MKKHFPPVLTLFLFLTLFNTAFSQETVERIEISDYLMVGWFRKEPKLLRTYIIENNTLYKLKGKKRRVEIAKCDTLALLLDRTKIDLIFRGDEKGCEDGYEVNVHIKYFVVDQRVETTYEYVFSSQAHCRDEASSVRMSQVQDELNRLIKQN